MAKKFDELRSKMSPERLRRNEAEANRMLLEMTLTTRPVRFKKPSR